MRGARAHVMLKWSPRILGMALASLAASLTLDAVREGVAALTIHAVPAAILVAIIMVAWRHELVGAIAFAILGGCYAVMGWRHLDWLLVIDGPLFAVALLYAASWLTRPPRAEQWIGARPGRS